MSMTRLIPILGMLVILSTAALLSNVVLDEADVRLG